MWGLMAPKMSQLDFLCWPHQVFFCFNLFLFIQGSKRAQLQTQTSGSGPQSQSPSHPRLEPDQSWEYWSPSQSFHSPSASAAGERHRKWTLRSAEIDSFGSFLTVKILSFHLEQEYSCCQVLWRYSSGQTHDPCRRDHVQTHLLVFTCRLPNKTSPSISRSRCEDHPLGVHLSDTLNWCTNTTAVMRIAGLPTDIPETL